MEHVVIICCYGESIVFCSLFAVNVFFHRFGAFGLVGNRAI